MSSSTHSAPAAASRFAPGTFSPTPHPAPIAQMVWSQARTETLLILRHGEQLLLSIVIPVALLIGVTYFPLENISSPQELALPFSLAIAAMSTGFTGQAIAVVFDRRYGALQRIGASGVPRWVIIGGKLIAVTIVSLIQAALLITIALIIGCRTTSTAIVPMVLTILVGLIAFTSWGLFLGGTLRSEIVLAGANLIWFLLLAAAGGAAMLFGDSAPHSLLFIPSVALTQGLLAAASGTVPVFHLVIMGLWGCAGILFAVRRFRFDY
ncbi:MAG: ABC transporter permease [Corynebacterium sp.]|nr:ABC transporter permease [Corynebacterium sp.]